MSKFDDLNKEFDIEPSEIEVIEKEEAEDEWLEFEPDH